jgi:hypothetical protein
VFSNELREPGIKKSGAQKHHAHRSFIRVAPSARAHWKIDEKVPLASSVGGYFYINLPGTLVALIMGFLLRSLFPSTSVFHQG